MKKILVVDDHAIVREGLVKVLAKLPEVDSVGEAETGEEALEKVQREAYDLVVMDISMPGRGGLEALQQIKEARPGTKVLVLSMHPETQYALRAVRAGASGYITKGARKQDLMEAIRKVLKGGTYVSNGLADILFRGLDKPAGSALHDELSDREFQVMHLLASGSSVSAIAESLCLSPKTVSTYRTRILEKLGLSTTADIIRYAITHQLVE